MKKIIFVALLSGVFLGSALADDFLAKVSNGALSDNSPGVKKLSADEAKQVVGGYITAYKIIDGYQLAVVAITTIDATDAGVIFLGREGTEIKYDANGNYDASKSSLCGADVRSCYMFDDTKTPLLTKSKKITRIYASCGRPCSVFFGVHR